MIRVFIVDDSAVVRQKLSDDLNRFSDIEVVGTAIDPYVARDKIVRLDPDVITLDVEMPRMDGLTFLKKIMRYFPKPVIIVSSLTKEGGKLALEALEYGAVEVMSKPGGSFSVGEISTRLAQLIRASSKASIKKKQQYQFKHEDKESGKTASADEVTDHQKNRKKPVSANASSENLIAIGASTGGTEAIRQVLSDLPGDSPGVLIVQHMPPKFTTAFAERLNESCNLEVREAKDGDRVRLGTALVAPGNYHMLLKKSGKDFYVRVKYGPLVRHHRPSVDMLFSSVAKEANTNSVGVLLTGMGVDGAEGMRDLHQYGATTIAQDENSCVVFGMPKEAIRMRAVDYVEDINNIGNKIINLFKEKEKAK